MTTRSALFVDFDNVYLGLRGVDPAAADRFASEPERWVQWLAAGADRPGAAGRRFLQQVCYLSPERFGIHRRDFAQAGFRVVDCPTSSGKNSADIHLVVDALDVLASPSRCDEFVIASADADFAPLLHRLRAHDRRTTVLRAGPAAPAYISLCDGVVSPDQLAAVLLDGEQVASADTAAQLPELPVQRRPATAVEVAACKAVLRIVHAADGPVPGAKVAQAARSAHPRLETGPGRFRAFLATHLPELAWSAGGRVHDPRCAPAGDVDA